MCYEDIKQIEDKNKLDKSGGFTIFPVHLISLVVKYFPRKYMMFSHQKIQFLSFSQIILVAREPGYGCADI